jgi:Cation transporting ATPase, C-terminus
VQDRTCEHAAGGLPGLSLHTVRNWTREGRLAHFRTAPGHRRFLRFDVIAVRAARRAGSSSGSDDAKPPRDASAPIVDRGLALRLGVASLIMAGVTLGVVAWGEERYELAVATTMGLTTLSLTHIAAALEAREPTGSIFS